MFPGPVKVCPQCGQHVPIDAQHCPNCGHAFRTQFVQQQPQYPPPNVVYVPVPVGSPYPGQYAPPKDRQLLVKWVIGLLIAGILGVAVFIVFRSKMPASAGTAGGGATLPIVPTSMFNDHAALAAGKVLIHWEKSGDGQTLASATNEGSEILPNLYLQFILANNAEGEWSEPYQVQYQPPGTQPQDAIPPGQAVPFTLPFEMSQIKRIHAYYVDKTPAGPVQYEVNVDQTQDKP